MTPDWRGGGALHDPRAMSQPSSSALDADARNGETPATSAADGERSRRWGGFAVPSAPAHVAAKQRRQDDNGMGFDSDATTRQRQQQDAQPQHHPHQVAQDSGASSSQSLTTHSVTNSQESTVTASTDQVVTPPASDTGGGLDMSGVGGGGGGADGKPARGGIVGLGESRHDAASHGSQLLHLSAIAAAQGRIMPDATGGGSRKRMADGEVKERGGSMSPVKGHSRTTSAVSMASTAGSHIGEVCRDPNHTETLILTAPAVRRPQDASLLRHGQGQPRLAVAVPGRGRIPCLPGRLAHLEHLDRPSPPQLVC